MALNRAPTAIQVNGAALVVKGASTDGALANWQRVPGLANFTLPDETGSTNEIQLMDGSVAFAQIAGVGSITGSVGAITGHPTHTFLAQRRRDGNEITATIVRPATDTVETAIADSKVASVLASGIQTVTVTGEADARKAKNIIREGLLVAIHAQADLASSDFFPVLKANADIVGSGTTATYKFQLVGGVAVTAATGLNIQTRRPGVVYPNIACTVNGFGDGDFQAGSAMAANVALQPAEALPVLTVEKRTLAEIAAVTTTGAWEVVFADVT